MRKTLEYVTQGKLLEAFKSVYSDLEATGTTSKRAEEYEGQLPEYTPGPQDFVNRSYADAAYGGKAEETYTTDLDSETFKFTVPPNTETLVVVAGDTDLSLWGDQVWLSGRVNQDDGTSRYVENEIGELELMRYSQKGYVLRSEIRKAGNKWAGTLKIYSLGDFFGGEPTGSVRTTPKSGWVNTVDAILTVKYPSDGELQIWINAYGDTDISVTSR